MAAVPFEIGETLADEAGLEELTALVRVDVVAQRGDNVVDSPDGDRVFAAAA